MGMHGGGMGGGFGGGFGGGGGGPGGPGGRFSREEEEKMERKVSDVVLLKRLMTYLGTYKMRVTLLLGVMVGSSIMSLVTPLMTKMVLDNFIVPGMTSGDTSPLNLWLAAMAGIVVLQFGLNYSREYLIAWVGSKIVYDLRRDMTSQLQSMSIRYFAEGETGRITSRVTSDVEELTHFLGMHVVSVMSELIIVVGALFLMVTFSPSLTLISLSTIPLMLIMPYLMR